MATDFHVIIIGAGSTGLLIAQGLAASNISYTIYERHESNSSAARQRNWTMALHWGSSHIKTLLPPELADDLKTVEPDPITPVTQEEETSFPFINGKTGEVLVRIQGATIRRANKEKLRRLFSKGVHIEYGKKLVDIVDDGKKVTAKFADGTEAVGDTLVGCDAGESVVRTWLLGKEKAGLEVMPMEFYNYTQKYTAEQARFIRDLHHPLIKTSIHPDHPIFILLLTNDVPDPEDPNTWSFQLIMSNWGSSVPPTSAERLARVKEIALTQCEPFRSAALWTKDDTHIAEDKITHWAHPVPWPNHGGRVTLAGDAAHCMTPYRGQGLNNALADAAAYVQALRGLQQAGGKIDAAGLAAAIDAYDAEVFERGNKEIAISAVQARVSHSFGEFMESPIVKQGLHVKKG